MLKVLLLIFSILFITQSAVARQIIVDNNHPNALDSNEATYESPLKTINAAIKIVKPGDEIIVKSGVCRKL
ncbi:MAG: hypothetical protein SNJ70_05515 [Armatimonadota bacterium]